MQDETNFNYNWEYFIENNLNEDDYDDFINSMLDNIPTQKMYGVLEQIQNVLIENGYEFKIFDDKYRICIKGSVCLLYLTKENGKVYVNKRLNDFTNSSKEIFFREIDIFHYLYMNHLTITPNFIPPTDQYIIKIEKCTITLYDYIHSDNKLSIKEILEILKKVALLHDIKILHRDLHPRNIMLLDNVWYIIDFNVAHYPLKTGVVTFLVNVGLEEYTDPIVYKNGLNMATVQTDIYSIGKIINFIQTKDPTNDEHALRSIVSHCIDGDITKRYKSVYEIIKDIKDLFFIDD